MFTHPRMLLRRSLLVLPVLAIIILLSMSGKTALTQNKTAMVPAQDRPINTLRDLNKAFIDIVAAVKPTVVTVSTERVITAHGMTPFGNDPFLDFFFGPQNHQEMPQQEYRQQGLGSGVIVGADGLVLTNNHVVQDADSIFVRTFDGKKHTAKIVGTDPKTDIAVLRIDARDLPYITTGNSDDLQVGEIVLAIGSPMSENLAYTVTQGIVSATGRSNVGLADYEDFIQTDAAINPGNSGGPLINLDGQLVGINTAILSRSGGSQGIGFAVPSNMATRIMNSLISTGKVIRGWLGVSIQDVSEQIAGAMGLKEPSGALVGDVLADSPAGRAGVEAGDLITAMDGKEIKNSAQLRNEVASTAPGTNVDLTILRDEREKAITVTLGELPTDIAQVPGGQEMDQLLGFTVETLTPTLAQRYAINKDLTGVIITSVDPQSAAGQAGLREGDLIRSVNKQPVETKQQFAAQMAGKKQGDTILLRVFRQGNGFFAAFQL
jgi:serine protease Do